MSRENMTDFTRTSHLPSTNACPVDFEVWLDDLQLFLQCDSKDGLSLFDLTSGTSTAPAADADSTVRSQWLTCDAAARPAVRNHLPSTEHAHFSQYKRALYDAVVARYSSPTTAALSRLMLPYLFPDLAAFATVADLVAHLRTSDARYRAALPTEFLPTNSPPMYITLYYLVTCLPDSLSSVRDHFLSLCPTELIGCSPVPLLPSVASAAAVDLVGTEKVGAASAPCGRRRTGKAKGSKGGGGGGGGSGGGGGGGGGGGPGGGGVGGGSGGRGGGGRGGGGDGSGGGGSEGGGAARGAATQHGGLGGGQSQQQLRTRETPSVQQLREWYAGRGRSGGAGPCAYVLRTSTRSGEVCGLPHTTQRCFGRLTDAWHTQFPDAVDLPRWHDLLLQNVSIFDLDFDAILAAMYALADITEGDCYLSTAPTESLHTFTLDSGASRSFFRDSTTLAPLHRPVAVSLAYPSGGPVLAHSSTVLPCPAAPSGLLSRLHLPSFSTNLVSGADLQDAWVDQFTPGGQRVTHCTCSRTGRHLATFTRRPGSSLYTLTTAPPPVFASGQVAASSQVFTVASRSGPASAPCSCRPLAHETLLWHHRLGHPSLPRLRGMASRALVSGLPRSLPPLPPGPAPTCVPCVEGRQRAAPHSSSFPPTEAPLRTLHMDVWGPARVRGQGHERYFLLVVDDYSRYTIVFPLRSKGEVTEVLIDWIRGARRQLSESFGSDLPVLRLHSDRGGEFSSDLLRAFCRLEGIRQTFTLPASPQQNGIAERRIGMVMDVARTSMIHAAAPHFLWPFAVQYAAHQINLRPRVSLPETTPTLRWTGNVGDASAFRVWGSRAFVRDTTADKLSSRAVPCVFLGFPPDAPGWQFYHPTSQDVAFDESVSYYRLFPYRTASPPLPPATLPGTRYSPGRPPPPDNPAPSGVSKIDPAEPVEVAVDSGAARGADPAGAGTGGAETGGAESGGAESGGAKTGCAEPRGVAPEGTVSGGAETARAESGGALGVPSRREPLSPQRLREWYSRRCRVAAGAGAAGGGAGAGAAGGTASAGGAGGATGTTGGAGAAGGGAGAGAAGGAAGAGAAGGAGGATGASGGAGTAGGGAGAGAAGGAAGAGAVGGAAGTGDPGAAGPGSVSAVFGGAVRPRPYYVPLLQQVLASPPSPSPPAPPFLSPPPVQSQSQLQPASPLPGPSPYSGPTRGLTERREPESRPVSPVSRSASPVHTVRAGRVSRPRPPPVPGTHSMTLRPSTAPQRVPLPSPPASSLPDGPDPESDSLRAASPTVTRFLATAVTDPLFESTAASALVTELVDFAAACRLDYAASLVAEFASASVCPPSVGGECALRTDVLEDRQEDHECFAAASPHLMSMLLAPEGDPDALDILTPRSYAEAIEVPYSSQWQAAMDVEMASWKSTGTYVDEVPPPGANIVSGMWIFRVKRPPGSPLAFKARYVARGFSQRQGVDFFQTFSPTPKMTTLRVLLHVAAQRDYELHSLDFSTAFLHGSLHEEIWLRCPPGFTGSFPAGTQWSLRWPVYGLRQVPREWHDTLRTTLAALGFAPSTADPSLFLRTKATLPPFYVLVYVDDLVFATADTEALAHVKSELQKRHTCTDLGELTSYLGLRITRDRAQCTITLTQSHMVQQVLQRFGFTYSSPQSTPLPTGHSLSAPPSDESVEPSGPYPELVGCLITSGMGLVLGGRARVVLTGHTDASWVDDLATQRSSQGYTFSLGSGSVSWRSTCSSSVFSSSCEAEIYAGAMAAQELRWLTYLLTDLGEAPRSPPVLYVDNKAMLALCQEHRLEHRTKHIALRYFLAQELQQRGQLRLAYVASQANTADVFTKALQPCDHHPCFAFLDWSCDLLFSLTLPMGSSVTVSSHPITDYYRAARLVVSLVLASLATGPHASPLSVSALTAAVADFASTHHLDYATRVVIAPPPCSLTIGGESALGCDILEDMQFELEFLAAASPSLCAMLLSLEGDPDALDIPTPRMYLPPPRANVVDGMWFFKGRLHEEVWLRRSPSFTDTFPPGTQWSLRRPVYGLRQSPREWHNTLRSTFRDLGFPQRDYELHSLEFSTAFLQGRLHEEIWLRRSPGFNDTFPPGTQWSLRRPVYGLRHSPREWHDTLRSTLRDLGFPQRDYELHSLDFSTVFLQGRLHEEIWLRRSPGFTDTLPPGTYLRRPVYGLRQSPREWHDTLRSTLRDHGFRPSSADSSLFFRTGSTPFLILVDGAARTITLTQSHMVQHVLRRFGFQFSTTQPTPLAVDHRLTGPFPDEPFESSGPYAELVGCLMYLMICTRPDLAFPLSNLSRFVATRRHRPDHWTTVVKVTKYLATTSGIGLVLGGTMPVVLTGHCDSSYVDDVETQRSTQGYCFSMGAGVVSWRSTRSSSVASSSAETEIYASAMAAQKLRWLTFLLADLGKRPRSTPTLYADNKAMILLCREPQLESIVKHIDANTADVLA
ncbi:unnamed protein product [Closterium sp. NIES-53]